MKKSITIKIPEPCHEGWNNMTPSEKGRFCSSCEKEVIDFSKKRDEELVKELEGKSNICGRFKSSQLNREVTLERKSSNSLLPYAASFLLPLTLMGSNPAGTDNTKKDFVSLGIGRYSAGPAERIQVITSGKITDALGKPIFNVEIIVKESGRSELSGMRGDYQIKSLDHETLIFKKDGFVAQEVKLTNTSKTINIKLHPSVEDIDIMVLGGIAAPTSNIPPPPPAPIEEMVIETLGDVVYEIDEVVEGEIEAEEIINEEEASLAETLENRIPKLSIEDTAKWYGNVTTEGLSKINDIIKEQYEPEKDSIVKIKGVVIDEEGLPLPGANILVKGTTTGTQTDFDGNYEMEVEAGQVLSYSYLGYITKEYQVKDVPGTINMVFDEATILGVMVVGGTYINDSRNNGGPVGAKYVVEPEEYKTSEYTIYTDHQRDKWQQGIREAHANEIEFKRLKQARKKAARNLKRAKRKRN